MTGVKELSKEGQPRVGKNIKQPEVSDEIYLVRDKQQILIFSGMACILGASQADFPLSLFATLPFIGISYAYSGLSQKEVGHELFLSVLVFLILPLGILGVLWWVAK